MTYRFRGNFTRLLFIGLTLVFLTDNIVAQGNMADLEGTITDPSGGVVSGAKVILENSTVGLVRETTSRETGEYIFLSLPPARYSIRVQAIGFRPAVVSDFVLTVGQKAHLPTQTGNQPLGRGAEHPGIKHPSRNHAVIAGDHH